MTSHERVDTVVIGGGQTGLAVGQQLATQARNFIVLDAHADTGRTWRDRWDSLRLFTPAGFSHLPGLRFPAPARSFPTKDQTADYLQAYAARFAVPIRHNTRVEHLGPAADGDGYIVTAGSRAWRAENVVIATGAHNTPHIPAFSTELDPAITQFAAQDYRRASQLPPGPVLVIGAGNSGAEIALDLLQHHRPVWLAGRDVGHIPALGNPLYRVMRAITVDTWPGRQLIPRAQASGGDPLGRVTRQHLRHANLQRVPKITGARQGLPALPDGRLLEPTTVIWATGYRPNYTWIDLPITDHRGQPTHHRGITRQPGIYFAGLPFQSSLASHLIGGVGADAFNLIAHLTHSQRHQVDTGL